MTVSDLIRDKVIEMLDSVGGGPSVYKVLVVDSEALRVLNSVLTLSELTGRGVLCVEGLHNKRKPYPNQPAIYFFGPQPNSVQQLIDDFNTRTGSPPYECVHVYCTTTLTDTLFDRIKSSSIVKHLRALKELNVDFTAPDSECFVAEVPDALRVAYNSGTDSLKQYGLRKIARKVAGVIDSFKEIPYIRYYGKPGTAQAEFAQILHEECKEFITDTNVSADDRSTFLVLGRDFDMVSPFMHEFTYHAMITDLLGIEDGKFKLTSDAKEPSKLDDRDEVWCKTKFMHIAEVMEYVSGLVSELSQTKTAKYALSADARSNDIQTIKETVQDLPEFTKKKELYAKHTALCQEVMKVYEAFGIERLSNVEQDLAVGEKISGRPSDITMLDIATLLKSSKLSHEDKVRLLLVYIIAKDGIPDNDRQELAEIAKLSMDEAQAIHNLSMLGVRLSASFSGKALKQYGAHCRGVDYKYDNFRWIPTLLAVLREFHEEGTSLMRAAAEGNNLEEALKASKFPFVGDKRPIPAVAEPEKRPVKASWAVKKKSDSQTLINVKFPKLIVFILGGISLSEVRVCNMAAAEFSREVIAGSTSLLRPATFLQDVSELHLTGRAARNAAQTASQRTPEVVVLSELSKKLQKIIEIQKTKELEEQMKNLEIESRSSSVNQDISSPDANAHRDGVPRSPDREQRRRRWAERRERGAGNQDSPASSSRRGSPSRPRAQNDYPPPRAESPSRRQRMHDTDPYPAHQDTHSRQSDERHRDERHREERHREEPHRDERYREERNRDERYRAERHREERPREPRYREERPREEHRRDRSVSPSHRPYREDDTRRQSPPSSREREQGIRRGVTTVNHSGRERGPFVENERSASRGMATRGQTVVGSSRNTPENLRYFEGDNGIPPPSSSRKQAPSGESSSKEQEVVERLGLRRIFTKKR